jgi:hypothetical protein
MISKHSLAAVAALCACALAACGDDDEDAGGGDSAAPERVALELSGSGKELTMKAPASVEGGVVELRFTNSAKKESDAQLVRLTGGHTADEALAAAEAWAGEGKALPEWIELTGGVGTVKPSGTGTAIQELTPGTYMAVSTATNASTEFKVTDGGDGGELPETAGRVDASEYAFESDGLEQGTVRVTVDNVGNEPHFVAASLLKPGKTLADVKRFVRTEKGPPPIDFEETWDTSAMDGGGKQVVEVELKAGKYAMLCWVPDRAGGPPHAVKGMISEAVVR